MRLFTCYLIRRFRSNLLLFIFTNSNDRVVLRMLMCRLETNPWEMRHLLEVHFPPVSALIFAASSYSLPYPGISIYAVVWWVWGAFLIWLVCWGRRGAVSQQGLVPVAPVQACQQTKNLQWLSHGLSTAVFEALALQTVGNVPLNNKLYALSIGFTFVRGGWLQF